MRLLRLAPLLLLPFLLLLIAWPSQAADNVTPGAFAARGLAVDPTHPGTVYVGLQDNIADNSGGRGIWKSTSYGAPGSFSRVDQTIGAPCNGAVNFDGIVMSIAVDGTNGDVYAVNVYGCNMGIFKSTNGGVNFTRKYPGDFNNIDIDPALPGHLIAAYHSRHDICVAECDTYVVQSFDYGETWNPTSVVPGGGWGQYAFFINSSTWFVSAGGHGLFRTTNSGASWTKVSTRESMPGDLIRVGSVLYTGVKDGVLRSTDNGATWTLAYDDQSSESVMGLAADPTGRLYTRSASPFSGSTRPFKTSLNGTTWTDYSAETFSNGPVHMAVDGQYVYASMWNAGVWRLAWGGPTSTPTATASPSSTPAPPTATSTATATSTPSPSAIPSSTATGTAIASTSTAQATSTASATPTPTPRPCLLVNPNLLTVVEVSC